MIVAGWEIIVAKVGNNRSWRWETAQGGKQKVQNGPWQYRTQVGKNRTQAGCETQSGGKWETEGWKRPWQYRTQVETNRTWVGCEAASGGNGIHPRCETDLGRIETSFPPFPPE